MKDVNDITQNLDSQSGYSDKNMFYIFKIPIHFSNHVFGFNMPPYSKVPLRSSRRIFCHDAVLDIRFGVQ